MLHLHAPTTETERIERARLDAEAGLAGAREAAANGDLDAMLRLIALLLDGIGAARIGRNSAEADEWMHRAAEAGPDAMRRIGDLLLAHRSGSGVDPAAAAPWFAKAAEAGDVRARIELAGLLWQRGIARDRVDLAGRHSIRLNDRYRLVFTLRKDSNRTVLVLHEIVDYH